MPYIGISEEEKKQMLAEMNISSVDDLFVDIPENLLLKRDLNLESGYSEWEVVRYFDELAKKNKFNPVNFKGAGAYKHHVPSLVKAICSRGEFLTAYTPYQAEVSQGTLEAIYTFQSHISELTGMDVCNASMYDGATAFAEAITMSYRLNKKRQIFISKNVHPEYLEVTKNYLDSLEVAYEFVESLDAIPEGSTLAIQNPDFTGEVVNSELFKKIVADKNLFLIVGVPESYSLVTNEKPGDYGANIVCGSVQSFGNALYYGGAQVGFIACEEKSVRQLPGRIIGKTSDRNGKLGYVLTFQAREQHIKRERASSNICTNQSLHALAVAVHLSLLGEDGLKKIAQDIWTKTRALKKAFGVFPNLEVKTKTQFNEFMVKVTAEDNTKKSQLKELFKAQGIAVNRFASILEKLSWDAESIEDDYLFTVSETHSLEDLNELLEAVAKILDVKAPVLEAKDLDADGIVFADINIPNKGELEVARHFTNLSKKNFSIENNFYPLGSCTMKYNPKINDEIAASPIWSEVHPYEEDENVQGVLEVYDELNKSLCEITGFHKFSLQPAAGAHGEYSALLMAKKYFEDEGEHHRDIVFVPDSAHGTNPASASMAGFKTITIKSYDNGDVDLEDLQEKIAKHKDHVAVFMLTNPSTLGLFNQNIIEVTKIIHEDGGLMYYDGANLNAIAGVARPGDMGFDLLHLNLHKTFSTPHGGGGPGAGPVGATEKLSKYLPSEKVAMGEDGKRHWCKRDEKYSIGRIRSFHGNFNVLLRALSYIKRHGKEGIRRIGQIATLNANYIQAKVKASDVLSKDNIFTPAFNRICKHEFVISASKLKEKYGVNALDVAKRLLDKGMHAPTIYFPLTVPEAIMIEPTETEPKSSLDNLVKAFEEIITEAQTEEGQEILHTAPHTTKFSRFDEVKAVKEPILSARMEAKLESKKETAC